MTSARPTPTRLSSLVLSSCAQPWPVRAEFLYLFKADALRAPAGTLILYRTPKRGAWVLRTGPTRAADRRRAEPECP